MDQDYGSWCDYLCSVWSHFLVQPHSILDLGCGTGKLTIPLAERGFSITGIDRSPEMLEVAKRKERDCAVAVQFFQQDMTSLVLEKNFDTVICTCDSLNYIVDEKDLRRVFRGVHDHIVEDGLFLFDLNSEIKLREIYGDQSYAEVHPDFAYFWENRFDENTQTCSMDLTFFVHEPDGRYCKRREHHVQKLWRPEKIFAVLSDCGWDLMGYYDFMSFSLPDGTGERWQFVARPKK